MNTVANCYHCLYSEFNWRDQLKCRVTGQRVRKTQKACGEYSDQWYDAQACGCTSCTKRLKKEGR